MKGRQLYEQKTNKHLGGGILEGQSGDDGGRICQTIDG